MPHYTNQGNPTGILVVPNAPATQIPPYPNPGHHSVPAEKNPPQSLEQSHSMMPKRPLQAFGQPHRSSPLPTSPQQIRHTRDNNITYDSRHEDEMKIRPSPQKNQGHNQPVQFKQQRQQQQERSFSASSQQQHQQQEQYQHHQRTPRQKRNYYQTQGQSQSGDNGETYSSSPSFSSSPFRSNRHSSNINTRRSSIVSTSSNNTGNSRKLNSYQKYRDNSPIKNGSAHLVLEEEQDWNRSGHITGHEEVQYDVPRAQTSGQQGDKQGEAFLQRS